MTLIRRKVAAVLATGALACSLGVVTATPAHADEPCTITGFSPRSITVGLNPKVATFKPTVTGCDLQGWSIQGGDYDFYVYDGSPQWSFAPYDNDEAFAKDVVVEAYNADYDSRIRAFTDAFKVRRNTVWDQFNASPEPVRKGSKITIKGRLRVVDWEQEKYVGYAGRAVRVEYRTKTGSYRLIKTVTSGSGGYVSTTVNASADGYWRLRYTGGTVAGVSTVTGDFVDVR